jgi:hypothetical protein
VIKSTSVVATLAFATAASAAESEYLLQLNTEAVSFEVLLNGKSAIKDATARGTGQFVVPINKYLTVGATNTLEIRWKGLGEGQLSYSVKERQVEKGLVHNQWSVKKGKESTHKATFSIAANEKLAKQLSIFSDPAPPAADIKLYGMNARSERGIWAKLRLNGVEVAHTDGEGGNA